MYMPQEIEVWYVIPAIRKELVKAMLSKGVKQKDIAKFLDLTEPAVSQYLKGKRGKEISFDNEILKEIEKSAEIIIKKPIELMNEMQRLIRLSRQKRIICRMHLNKDRLPEKCCACMR